MSPLTAAILDRLAHFPLGLVELMEDLNLDEWEEADLECALRELIASGLVCRLNAPVREEQPFYTKNLVRSDCCWDNKSHQGSVINIDSEGMRKTYNNAASEAAGTAAKVFVFGGSTIWGAGVRDDLTIPSLFAKGAESKGVICKVTNFGRSGYVSTQEVIELLLQLQRGNVPDVVRFRSRSILTTAT